MKWLLAAFLIGVIWMLLRRPKRAETSADELTARRTLGVGPRADAKAIRAAHRRLVAKTHPDRGGSADETRRYNAARDLLLGRR